MTGRIRQNGLRDALVLPAISGAVLGFDIGARTFATNDETRFPMLARDILAHGEWWLPRLNGVPHLDKPPLQAWLIALAAWPVNAVTDSNATLPSIAAALAVVLTTYWIAGRLFDARVARAAALIVVTTAGVFGLARAPMPDMTLCAALTGAIAALAAAEFGGWRHGYFTFTPSWPRDSGSKAPQHSWPSALHSSTRLPPTVRRAGRGFVRGRVSVFSSSFLCRGG